MKREVRLFDELDRFASGGEITHALALTFGYDGDVAAERIFTPLIQKYGVRHPVVITSGKVDEGTALGVSVLRAGPMGRTFHPKLFLAVRDEAVLVAVGSANLTRGGLGANLELLTTMVFGNGSERPLPRKVLEDVLTFAGRVVEKLPVAPSSRKKVLEVLDTAAVVLPDLGESRKGPDIRFVHSLDEALWDQVRATHGDDAVSQLIVLSPFFEIDDPDLDEADSLLRHALGDGLPWAPRAKAPRCLLHTSALTNGMSLPRNAVEELGAAVELRPQALSVEPRRLHAKVLAILGKKRTTMLWGSPNFTPAALLRRAGDGNVECGLLWSVPTSVLDAGTLVGELDLGQAFHTHRGPLPEAKPSRPQPPEILVIGEILYDPESRLLVVHGEVLATGVRTIRVRLDGCGTDAAPLVEGAVSGIGPFALERANPDIEEEDPETGKRRLRSTVTIVEALDAEGIVLVSFRLRLNVRFDDALEVHGNLLLGKEAISADALLVPSTAPPEQRVAQLEGQIARWKAARRGDRSEPSRHQASLDAFFRNVRRGLDARFANLVQRKGSRFALLRWSTDLERALAAARVDSFDETRRLYLLGRVAAHIERVLDTLPGWHTDLEPVRRVLHATKLADALEGVLIVESAVRPELMDAALGMRRSAVAALRRFAREEG